MRDEKDFFCTRCFSRTVCIDACHNCGSGGTNIEIPLWAIDSIRENASWLGKRFYPHKEDYWNRFTIKLWKMRTLIINFKIERCEAFPRKLKIFTWRRKNV
jgi:hypothetical protein